MGHPGHTWSKCVTACNGETIVFIGKVARPERVELPTFWFVAKRSIQLSYGRVP